MKPATDAWLSPCVLPRRWWRKLLASAALLAGTLTFFGGLALVTAWLHWTWRTLFQAPWFRAARAFLRAVLGAYSLAGNGVKSPQWFFGYRPPVTSSRIRPACWRALCSAPCTRPFLGGAMTFALTPPPVPSWRCSWRGRGSGLALSRTVDAQRLEYRAVSTGRCAYNT